MYSDFKANFDEVLEKDGCFNIDHRNIQTLAVEIFKFFNGLSATIMKYFRLSHQPHTAWGIRKNYIVEIPKRWRMGLSQSHFWHSNSGQ